MSLTRTASDDRPGSKPLSATLERLEAHTPDAGRYELVGELARGGMGIIQRVWDGDLGRAVARKILGKDGKGSDSRKSDPRTVGRFLEEAQVTAQLEHPGIVPVHELGLDERGTLYFTMRLVRGEDLHKIFEHVASGAHGWSTTRALGVLLKACEALAYAHKKGVIHRDLKPANVMVGRFGEVYVMDWGLARVLDEPDTKDVRLRVEPASSEVLHGARRTELGTPDSPLLTLDGDVVGTPAYMAPEQARGELELIGPRSDVYALGAMLYHLVSGRVPYTEPGKRLAPHSVLQRVLAGPPRALETLAPATPPELLAICDRAMARALEERYESVLALAEDLRAYLEQRVVKAYRRGPWIELVKWTQRNRLSASSLAALLLVLPAAGFSLAALANRRRLEQQRELAERSAATTLAEIDTLWPIHPHSAALMDAWLERAKPLAQLLPEVESELAEFERVRSSAARTPDVAGVARKADDFELRSLEYALHQYSQNLEFLRTGNEGELPPEQIENELAHAPENLAVLELEVPYLQGLLERLRADRDRIRDWRYADHDLAGRHTRLVRFASDLEQLARADTGAIATIEARSRLAKGLAARTIEAEEARWKEALQAIADPGRAPTYGGLILPPQLGLVPLGPDPESHLWEFWHVLSGDAPARGSDGRWTIRPETGIVLVLVPGGRVTMGSQADDPAAANFFAMEDGIDQGLASIQSWIAEVEVEPFFLSKYELTQGQWLRLTGTLPAEHRAGHGFQGMPHISRTHPIESVSWNEAQIVLVRHGLELPTEAQWERAARAGTQTKYATGARFDSVLPLSNFGDRSYYGSGRYDDGFPLHAPVDGLAPNAWGFHGLFGNVEEWCRDWYGSSCERGSLHPPTGEHVPNYSQTKAMRGAGFRSSPSELFASSRRGRPPDFTDEDLGLRPARAAVFK